MALPFQTPPFNPLGGGPQGRQQFIPRRTEGGQPPFNPAMQRLQPGRPERPTGAQQMQPQFEMMGGQKTQILNAQPGQQQMQPHSMRSIGRYPTHAI